MWPDPEAIAPATPGAGASVLAAVGARHSMQGGLSLDRLAVMASGLLVGRPWKAVELLLHLPLQRGQPSGIKGRPAGVKRGHGGGRPLLEPQAPLESPHTVFEGDV